MTFFGKNLWILAAGIIFILGCCNEPAETGTDLIDLTGIPYNPQAYEISTIEGYPQLEQPASNMMTEEGVELGRHLFYDNILSVDSTMSCANCHKQEAAFTDGLPVSTGVDGVEGTRSSMSLVDVGFFYNGLFWDGRETTLEDQALLPIEDEIELHHMWPDLVGQLQNHSTYPEMFRKAFGIENNKEITRDMVVKAIAQFERSIVSIGSSKYDRVLANKDVFEPEELMGFKIFFDRSIELPDGQCLHCHGGPLFTDNEYRNNGLDTANSFTDFDDLGRGEVEGIKQKNGMFRTPSLRNIALTAPYMHDGRFETLEEVLDHYISGGHPSPNIDPLMDSIFLDNKEKAAVIAFLKTLSDEALLTNSAYSNPH